MEGGEGLEKPEAKAEIVSVDELLVACGGTLGGRKVVRLGLGARMLGWGRGRSGEVREGAGRGGLGAGGREDPEAALRARGEVNGPFPKQILAPALGPR